MPRIRTYLAHPFHYKDSPDKNRIVLEMMGRGLKVIDPFEEEKKLLQDLILRLPIPFRTVVILRYFHDICYQEIAETLGINVALVKIRIFRAKKLLLEMMEEDSNNGGSKRSLLL